MSTRWYPLYQKGNPQLRVLLPNFWMKILNSEKIGPPNVVQFGCSMEMTKHDIQNYLEKIYKIPVTDIHIFIKSGQFRKASGANYIVKDDDLKVAKVTLPTNEKFEFPNLFPEEEAEEKEDSFKKIQKTNTENWQKILDKNKHRPGIPSWFSI